jgi:hypothetical protein
MAKKKDKQFIDMERVEREKFEPTEEAPNEFDSEGFDERMKHEGEYEEKRDAGRTAIFTGIIS